MLLAIRWLVVGYSLVICWLLYGLLVCDGFFIWLNLLLSYYIEMLLEFFAFN
jgi:hypothetical protein